MSLIPPTSRPSQTPRIILGLMTFGPPGTEDKGSRITSLDEYKQCLDFLQQKGYNELDTAKFYIAGQQEGFTREAGWKERGFSLATKVRALVSLTFFPICRFAYNNLFILTLRSRFWTLCPLGEIQKIESSNSNNSASPINPVIMSLSIYDRVSKNLSKNLAQIAWTSSIYMPPIGVCRSIRPSRPVMKCTKKVSL